MLQVYLILSGIIWPLVWNPWEVYPIVFFLKLSYLYVVQLKSQKPEAWIKYDIITY